MNPTWPMPYMVVGSLRRTESQHLHPISWPPRRQCRRALLLGCSAPIYGKKLLPSTTCLSLSPRGMSCRCIQRQVLLAPAPYGPSDPSPSQFPTAIRLHFFHHIGVAASTSSGLLKADASYCVVDHLKRFPFPPLFGSAAQVIRHQTKDPAPTYSWSRCLCNKHVIYLLSNHQLMLQTQAPSVVCFSGVVLVLYSSLLC